jgi:hypothetical protein
MSELLKGTSTERRKIRTILFSGAGSFDLNENDDGTWYASITDIEIEGTSPADVLRSLAEILEES